MTHDPVCLCSGICDPPSESCSMRGNACGCECPGIALGRADEREKAAQRVEAVRLVTSRPDGFLIYLDEAVAAVRGES